MTPEEKQLLTDLANKIAQTPAPARDPEAEDFIRTHIGARPDALYLMTQTVLIQNMAIDHANQEIAQLRQQPPASGGSFLGGAPAGQPQYHEQPMQPQYPQQQYQQQQPQYAPPPPQGGGSSFLATAAKTVAGVAAGALAFEGIRSLFHSGGGGGGFGMPGGSSFLGGGGLMGRQGETIVNNYYDNPESGGQRLDDQAVDDQTYDDRAADDVTDDDQNYDDQAVDDSSDDSGSSDDNSDGLT
jgi:uncharacterized protein